MYSFFKFGEQCFIISHRSTKYFKNSSKLFATKIFKKEAPFGFCSNPSIIRSSRHQLSSTYTTEKKPSILNLFYHKVKNCQLIHYDNSTNGFATNTLIKSIGDFLAGRGHSNTYYYNTISLMLCQAITDKIVDSMFINY